MDRFRIANVLLECGVDSSLDGFGYIIDAVMDIDGKHIPDIVWSSVYDKIARKYKKKCGKVIEKSIRYALDKARIDLYDYDKVEKYIGLHNESASSSIVNLYIRVNS